MMLTSAVQAERHRRRHGTPGPAGRYVWLLATLTATIVALNASTLVEAALRFTLPLAAAGLWWISITAERDDEPEEVTARRAALAARRAATWAITPQTLLVAAGIMRPCVESITDAERQRRIRQMVIAADRLHTAPAGSRRARRSTARLHRHARLASARDIAEVRARVDRATRITDLVLPGNRPAPAASTVSTSTPATATPDTVTATTSANVSRTVSPRGADPADGVKVPATAWRTAQWINTWIRMCRDGDLVHGPITDNHHARSTYGASARHLNNIRRAAVTGALRDRARQLRVPLPPGYVDDPAGDRRNGKAAAKPLPAKPTGAGA
jgi:hypothetical protein